MSIKEKLKHGLENYRNRPSDKNEKAFLKQMGLVRLLFFVPFLIAAILFYLLYSK